MIATAVSSVKSTAHKAFLGKRRSRRRYGPRKWVPCSKASPDGDQGGMQVTYMISKMNGAYAVGVGLLKKLTKKNLAGGG